MALEDEATGLLGISGSRERNQPTIFAVRRDFHPHIAALHFDIIPASHSHESLPFSSFFSFLTMNDFLAMTE